MRYMGRLAGMKRTIICSIHQPGQSIWRLFQKLEVLSEGYLLYFGELDDVVPWFSGTLGYQYLPRRDGTACDWLLDLVSVSFARSAAARYPGESPSGNQSRGPERTRGMKSVADIRAAADRFRTEELPLAVSDNPAFSIKGDAEDSGGLVLCVEL
jgi:ABC-type multidrug transport system ATPase subunit